MSAVVLAVGNDFLREVCRQEIGLAGHSVVALDRPLAVLSVAQVVAFTLICIDDSPLGRSVLQVAKGFPWTTVGIGLSDQKLAARFELPLDTDRFRLAIEQLVALSRAQPGPLCGEVGCLRRLRLLSPFRKNAGLHEQEPDLPAVSAR